MPNLYNRPRWTIPYLVEQLRTQAPLGLVLVLASGCLLLLGGVSVPAELAATASGAEAGLPWRLRTAWATAYPLVALLRATGLLTHPALPGAPLEAALLMTHALAGAVATWMATRLLAASGFKSGMRLRVGLLLGFGTCLAGAAWQADAVILTAAAIAAAAAGLQAHRRHGGREALGLGVVGLALAILLDPRAAVWLPVVAAALVEGPRRRQAVAGATLTALAILVGFGLWALLPGDRAFLLSQLAPGELARRFLAATIGLGSCLLVAAPPAALALLGAAGLTRFDRPLAVLTLGGAVALGAARILLVLDPVEAQVPLCGWAPILPLLAPAMGFGLLSLRRRASGGLVVVALALVGAATQAQRFMLDPAFVARQIRRGGMEFPLDRSFSPELAEPVVGMRLIRAWFAGEHALRMRLPSVLGRSRFEVSLTGLEPRPWPARLARWARSDDEARPEARLGSVSLGSRKTWVGLLGAITAWILLVVGLLSLAVLGERLTSLGKLPLNHLK